MNPSRSSASRASPPLPPPPRRRPRDPASSQNTPHDDDYDRDTLIPTVFHWKFPGTLVYVAGAWDGWRRKAALYRNGREHLALLYLPMGEFQCKFFVDDNWQCAPDLPTRTDEYGNTNNIIKVTNKEPHFDSSAPLLENKPPSPLSSYKQNACADFPSDPPVLPPHLQARTYTILPQEDIPPELPYSDDPPEPEIPRNSAPHDGAPGSTMADNPFFSHVYVNHLYYGRAEQEDEDVQSLSQTTRIGNKVINTVLVTTKLPKGKPPDEGSDVSDQP